MQTYIGVDLGGTNVRVAKVDETGAILQIVKEPTEIGKGVEQRHQLLEGHPGRPDQGHRTPQPAAYQVAVADDAQAGDLRFQILTQQHALTAVCRGCDDVGRLLFVVQQGEDVAHLAFELRPVEQVLLTAQKYVGLCGILQNRSGCADDRNQLRVDLAAQLCQQPVGQVHRRNEGNDFVGRVPDLSAAHSGISLLQQGR